MVETIRLESGHTLTGIGGSNPSLSAMKYNPPDRHLSPFGVASQMAACVVLIIAMMTLVGTGQSQSAEIKSPAPEPHPANCSNPTWPPRAIFAKYPPNAKPGFDSPEEVTAALEKRWSLADIRKFAIPERRHNDAYQNLVVDTPEVWAGRLYCDRTTGFDSIEWYATVESGRGKEHSLKEYSLQARRGKNFWLLEFGSPASVEKPPNVEPDFRAPYFLGRK